MKSSALVRSQNLYSALVNKYIRFRSSFLPGDARYELIAPKREKFEKKSEFHRDFRCCQTSGNRFEVKRKNKNKITRTRLIVFKGEKKINKNCSDISWWPRFVTSMSLGNSGYKGSVGPCDSFCLRPLLFLVVPAGRKHLFFLTFFFSVRIKKKKPYRVQRDTNCPHPVWPNIAARY